MKVHVIGAGIGGLSVALGLRRIGCEVVVSERAPGLHEVGAGISLWSNAMQALDTLGAGSAVRTATMPARVVEFRLSEGHRCVARLDLAARERSLGLGSTFSMIHRTELVAALAKQLPSNLFRWNQELTHIEPNDEYVTAEFADGSRVMSELLIGADGVHSVARRHVLGSCRPRYAGYTCYRGVCEAKSSLVPSGYVCETWGRGMRFGITSLQRDRVYWWFVRLAPPLEPDKNPHERLRQLLHKWAPPVPQLIKLTRPDAILKNDIVDHEPQLPWHRGRVCLVGDAAHAVTPNVGQGGCLAIEDAVVLSRLVRSLVLSQSKGAGASIDLTQAERLFAAFESERFERCRWLARKSNQLGSLGKWSSSWSVALRNFLIGATPTSVMWRSIVKATQYDAGPL